jgi:hypothetical protein
MFEEQKQAVIVRKAFENWIGLVCTVHTELLGVVRYDPKLGMVRWVNCTVISGLGLNRTCLNCMRTLYPRPRFRPSDKGHILYFVMNSCPSPYSVTSWCNKCLVQVAGINGYDDRRFHPILWTDQ